VVVGEVVVVVVVGVELVLVLVLVRLVGDVFQAQLLS
jgi:hypothetical protein